MIISLITQKGEIQLPIDQFYLEVKEGKIIIHGITYDIFANPSPKKVTVEK